MRSDTTYTAGLHRSPGEIATRAGLVVMGLFTATPVQSLVRPDQLESGYGVVDPDPMVLTLLQHRGVVQLLIGAALVWAAFRVDVRVPVALAAVVSKSSALGLILSRPQALDQASPGILAFDAACVVALLVVAVVTVRGSGLRRAPTVPVGTTA